MKSLLLAAALLVALTACAAGPGARTGENPETGPMQSGAAADAAGPREALAAQTLAPGECGLFLFEVREPNNFVLFESETRRLVRLIEDDEVVELGVSPQSAEMVPGDRFRRIYLDAQRNMTYTLTGRVGEETRSGQRLEEAVLRTRRLDGTEIVRPLGGVRRCMARGG
ncbi:hypothetical protein ACWCOP_01510 [Maricaulaceae bacterium MS644]